MLRKFSYVLAGFVIAAALLVLASRLLTPVLDEHRTDIETWASSFLDMPVKIGKARLSWYQYQPVVTLDNVTILDKKNKGPVLQIGKLIVLISIPKSIWQREAVMSGLIVSGVDLDISESKNGEIAVLGFPAFGGFSSQPYSNESHASDILTYIANQPRLMLDNVDIRFTDKKGKKRFLTLFNLQFENDAGLHSIYGKILLHQEIPTELIAKINWHGDVTDFNKIEADISVQVSKFSLVQWLKDYTFAGWQLNTGIANARIWARWSQGAFTKIQSTFEAYSLNFYSATDKTQHKITRLSGDVGWKREGNQDIFAGDDIFIDMPEHLWPSTNFYVALTKDTSGTYKPSAINLGYVDLKEVQRIIASSPKFLPSDIEDALHNLQLTGEIQRLSSHFDGSVNDIDHVSLNAHFAHISFMPWKKLPGIKDLSGILSLQGKQGVLSLQSTHTSFSYNSIFANPITLDHLIGDIHFKPAPENAWHLSFEKIHAMNQDLSLDANGSLSLFEKKSPYIDLSATFNVQKVKNINTYLPLKIFEPGLNEWLKGAFLSGTIPQGSARLKGSLVDYPFEKGNGEFLITAKINDLDFHFAPDWPLLTKVKGEVTFKDVQMLASISEAELLGIPIKNVTGEIPTLGGKDPSILTVKAPLIKMDFKQGLKFVKESPLQKTIGSMFTNMELSGETSLALLLTVPLADADNTKVSGDLKFDDALMKLDAWKLDVTKLNGGLHFTENSSIAKDITGQLFGKPFLLDIDTLSSNKSATVTRATIKNHLEISDLETWLKVPLSKVVNGATDVVALLDLQLNAPVKLHVESDLVGINVLLPDQYAKNAAKKMNFTADLIAQDKQPLKMKMNYAKILDVALVLEKAKESFNLTAANISLGAGSASWPEDDGLYISGTMPSITWEKIKSYADGNGASDSDFAKLKLEEIDMTIGKIELPSYILTNAHVTASPHENGWDISIASNELDGDIDVPLKMTPQSMIIAQLKNLKLSSANSNPKAPALNIDVKSLPGISFNANNVTYNNLNLGEVSFKTTNNGSGQTIQSLTVNSSRLNLNATGNWSSSSTKLKGSASSMNVSGLLNSLGFDAHNFVANKGKVDFQLTWSKAPFALSLASMNGTVDIDIAAGRIVELSQTSGAKMDIGRMLNIFSLQTIPRRLSLDFSDVTQKGYSFDSFRGNFRFENGNAYTNNTRFVGPVARVSINGRIGLAEKDYDLTLSVTPNVTSSIPVAATLLTGQPAIGLAAWAVDKVISSGVSKATTYYYSVRGPWSNPAWNAVGVPAS